jgi:hypothetical protein
MSRAAESTPGPRKTARRQEPGTFHVGYCRPVFDACRAKRGALCAFPGHLHWFSLAPTVIGTVITTTTIPDRPPLLELSLRSGAVVILTSAARSGGEVRITEAERPRRIHPGRRGAGPKSQRIAPDVQVLCCTPSMRRLWASYRYPELGTGREVGRRPGTSRCLQSSGFSSDRVMSKR